MPIDPNKKPSEKEFQDFLVYQTNLWSGAVTIWKKAQAYYFGTADIWEDYYLRHPLVPVGSMPPFHPALFSSKVDQIVSGHLAFEPKITRRPVRDGLAHKQHADLLEKGMQALVSDSFQRSTNYPTKVAGKNIVLFDYTPALPLLNTEGMARPERREGESAEDFDEREWEWLSRKQRWNPIEIIVPAPGDVLMDPLETNPPVALWKQSANAWDLTSTILSASIRHNIYRGKLPQFDEAFSKGFSYVDPYEPKEYLHWYTPRWHGIFLGTGENLIWEPNVMGVQPVSHGWAGDLISPVDTKFNLGYWARQAMMYKVIDEIVAEAQATVADQTLLLRHSNARIVYKGDPTELTSQLAKLNIFNVDPEDLSIEKLPPVLPQSFNQRQMLQDAVDRHTVSPLDAGFQDVRTDTATGIAIKSENTSRQVQAPRAKLEHIFASTFSNAAQIIYHSHSVMKPKDGEKSIFQEIGIGDAKVRVVDMEDQFHFQVDFSQTDLASRMQAVDEAIKLKKEGAVGVRHLRKVAGIENDKEAQDDVLDTMLMQHPEVLAEMLAVRARDKNMNEAADAMEKEIAAMKLQKLQQGALPPGGQAPIGGGSTNGRV